MDSFNLGDDIKVLCVTAKSFPEGIESAQLELQSALSGRGKRHFFGISSPNERGEIIYKAAAEEIEPGESERLGLQTFTIKKGYFNGFFIKNFRENKDSIAQAFKILLKQQEVDPNGYCLEWYIGENDVKCMVRVDDKLHFTGISDKM